MRINTIILSYISHYAQLRIFNSTIVRTIRMNVLIFLLQRKEETDMMNASDANTCTY